VTKGGHPFKRGVVSMKKKKKFKRKERIFQVWTCQKGLIKEHEVSEKAFRKRRKGVSRKGNCKKIKGDHYIDWGLDGSEI